MKKWEIKELLNPSLPIAPELPELIRRILADRGLRDVKEIQDFLNPDFSNLYDPFMFRQMQAAVERTSQAIERKEKIVIYADYDADAITACSVLYLAFKKLGVKVDYYIPDRFTEGYGINEEAVRKIAADGGKLLITVDCGINAIKESELANSLGLDVIITDHHELTHDLPQVVAVINPKNPHDEYPFPYLTGVGVAFKFVQALFSHLKVTEGWEKWLLDLVAIGTVADLQSMTGENRILVGFGLKVLAKTRWLGLRELMKIAGVEGKIDTFTLGFIIAPRINAAGRIKHASAAFELLVCEDPEKAGILALELNELNTHRQKLTEQILSEARSQVELMPDRKILIAHGVDWPKGIVGLVAGKLTEKYNKPVLAISSDLTGLAVGSARSVENFNIVEALKYAEKSLVRFGGHAQAAGFTLNRENLENLHFKLLEYADSVNLVIEDPVLRLDAEVTPEDITWEVNDALEKMAPFGIGNLKPKFVGRKFKILDFRLVGANKHLKLKIQFGDKILDAIAFNQGLSAQNLSIGSLIDAVFEISANEWNGNRELQIKILDIKIIQ